MTNWRDINEALNPSLKRNRKKKEAIDDLINNLQPPIVQQNPFKNKCSECGASQWALFSLLSQNGLKQVQAFCRECGDKDSRALPHEFFDPDNCPIYNDKREGFCMRCGKFGTEEHHYAPRHLFPDSEQWGTIRLCVEHHRQWHQIVTPNMSHSTGEAA